jgi:hypothetical protein
MALIDNLVSYYKLDEASGNALDAHSTNDLTDTNTVGTATGKINNGRDFESGSTEYFFRSSAIVTSLPISVGCWIKLESTGDQVIFSLDASSGTEILEFIVNAGKLSIFYNTSGGGGFVVAGSTTLSSGVWYYASFSAESASSQLYINGVSEGTGGMTMPSVNQTHIGTRMFSGSRDEYFDGIIDELGVWNRRVPTADWLSLYNSGSGLAYPFSTAKVGTGLTRSKKMSRLSLVG